MDDPKHPFAFQKSQEPLQEICSFQTLVCNEEGNKPIKNRQSRITFKTRNRINGSGREETHLQEKYQHSELMGYHVKLKKHFPSSSMADNKKQTENASDESDVHGGNLKINCEKATCWVCGKSFLSMKSLCGHMRLHPGRHWRGIKPPISTRKTISSCTVSVSKMGKIDDQQQNSPSTSGRSDFDLLQFMTVTNMKGWSVTGKRIRASSDEREAADGLLNLVHGNSLDLAKRNNEDRTRVTEDTLMAEIENPEQVLESPDLPKKRKMEGLDAGNPDIHCKKPKILKENEYSRDGLIPGLVKMDSGLEILNGFQEFLGENMEVDQSGNTYTLYNYKPGLLMKKIWELGMMNYKQTPKSSDGFNCTTCNKSFPSYQALGGHKSSHMNCKNNIQKAYVEEFSLLDIAVRNVAQVDESQGFNASISKKNVGTHRCKICNKTFPTGQALGGHQRQHWARLAGVPITSVALPGEAITVDHKLVEINLNEPHCGIVNVSG